MRRGWGSVEQNAKERVGSVKMKPPICNDHLPYFWWEGRMGVLDTGVVMEQHAHRRGQGLKVSYS